MLEHHLRYFWKAWLIVILWFTQDGYLPNLFERDKLFREVNGIIKDGRTWPVVASSSGVVVRSNWLPSYGRTLFFAEVRGLCVNSRVAWTEGKQSQSKRLFLSKDANLHSTKVAMRMFILLNSFMTPPPAPFGNPYSLFSSFFFQIVHSHLSSSAKCMCPRA